MSERAIVGAVTFSKAAWLGFSLFTVEFAIKSLNALCRFKCFQVLLSQSCRFFNPPLTKVDSFLKHNCLHFLYLPGLLAASHRNPVCTCSSRKGHILASVLGKFRKVPLLISSHLHGGKMVLSSFRLKPCRKRE